MPVKILFRDLLEMQKIIDTGIVDKNVQSAERMLGLREDSSNVDAAL